MSHQLIVIKINKYIRKMKRGCDGAAPGRSYYTEFAKTYNISYNIINIWKRGDV